jgi:hypothetical protein
MQKPHDWINVLFISLSIDYLCKKLLLPWKKVNFLLIL